MLRFQVVTGHEYRDLVASYLFENFQQYGLAVYTEISLGKTIIGKNRRIDVFVVRETDNKALAIECKFQGGSGTTDEKIPYALEDLGALRVAACLCYAGEGWSKGVLHTLEASPLAVFCLPNPSLQRETSTLELDHVIAAEFGLWTNVISESRRFPPQPKGRLAERLPAKRAPSRQELLKLDASE